MPLNNILMADNVLDSIHNNIDELLKLVPEIKDMIGCEHKNPAHKFDVWNHTLYALNLAPKNLDVRLTLLFHDIGKPHSFTEVDGVRHFTGHPKVSKEITNRVLKRLGYEDSYIEKICYLVGNHDYRITKDNIIKDKELEYKRFVIQQCDIYAHDTSNERFKVKELYIANTKKLFEEE